MVIPSGFNVLRTEFGFGLRFENRFLTLILIAAIMDSVYRWYRNPYYRTPGLSSPGLR